MQGLIPGLGRSPGGGNDNPLQYSWLENPHGQRSLVGYSLWGCKESDLTKHTLRELFYSCCVCVCVCVCGTYLKSFSPSLFPGGKFLGIFVNERARWLLGSSVDLRWLLNSDALVASYFNLEASWWSPSGQSVCLNLAWWGQCQKQLVSRPWLNFLGPCKPEN